MLKLPPADPKLSPSAQIIARAEMAKNINLLNEALGDIKLTPEEEQILMWLCQWEYSTLKNIISAFQKAQPIKERRKTRCLIE